MNPLNQIKSCFHYEKGLDINLWEQQLNRSEVILIVTRKVDYLIEKRFYFVLFMFEINELDEIMKQSIKKSVSHRLILLVGSIFEYNSDSILNNPYLQ